MGADLHLWVHPVPQRRLWRRHELTTDPWSQPLSSMDPIGDHGHPSSDSHSTGGANESRTCKSWGWAKRWHNPGPQRRGTRRRQHGRGGATQRDCLQQRYAEGRWGLFWHAGAMRLITRKASLSSVELPSSPVDPKCKACPTFHIKGMCNAGCGNMTDHVAHTREQDPPLWGWAVKEIPEITAPLAPVASPIDPK